MAGRLSEEEDVVEGTAPGEAAAKPAATPEPSPPEATARMLAETVEELVAQRLAALGLGPHLGHQVNTQMAQARGQVGGLFLTDPRALPPPAEAPPEPPEVFPVPLPRRFAEYLRRRAAAHGQSEAEALAGMVRWFWQHDEWRLSAPPVQPGQAAATYRSA